MFRFLRQHRARKLLRSGFPRRVRIHSVAAVPSNTPRPNCFRIAFEFLDPPGPWSIQFYEAAPDDAELIRELAPGGEAAFFESEDAARTRVLQTASGQAILPA